MFDTFSFSLQSALRLAKTEIWIKMTLKIEKNERNIYVKQRNMAKSSQQSQTEFWNKKDQGSLNSGSLSTEYPAQMQRYHI